MGANVWREVRRLAAFCIGLLMLLGGPGAFAQSPDQTLFGPQQYNRTTGSPNTYSASFTVPASVGAPFLLRIVNGTASGDYRISSGWVKVNGVQVVGPADFGQKVALIERSVSLAPTNTLEVQLASAPGGYVSMTVLGRRVLPVPTALAPNPLTITAGANGTLTATLSPPPSEPGMLALASANTALVTVPAAVAFAAGQSTVPFPVTGVATGSTSVTASASGGAASAAVNVTPAPPTVTALTPAALTVTQGSSGTLSVTISAAQASATPVALASSHSGIASVPATVSVPAGELSTTVPVAALSPGDAQISASLNGASASSQVTVTAAPPTVVSLVPVLSSVALGGATSLRLTISATQSADTVVPLAASPASIIALPAEAIVPAGSVAVLVPVATLAYGQAGITATLNGASASAAINVVPPPAALMAIEPSQFSMTVGATSLFTVRVNAAQATNTEVMLAASDPAVLQVPASVSIAQGATSASFSATALTNGAATISALLNEISKDAAVQVTAQAAAVVSLVPSPLPLQQGAAGSLTVTLNAAQPADTTVEIANTDPSVATVPATVTVPAGVISAQVSVSANLPGTAQVTASFNGSTASASANVAATAPVVSQLAPVVLELPKGTPGVLRVSVSRAPNIATAVALSSTNSAVASVPLQVNIAAGALFAEFPVAANAVGEATISASLNGASVASAVTVSPAELVKQTLSPQTPTNYVGETVPFSATGTMTDGSAEDFTARVTWSSSNTAVASIAASGVATLHAQGETTIGATFSFTAVQTGLPVIVSASTPLTVKTPTPLALTAPTTSLTVTQSVTVTVTTSDPPPFGGLLVHLSGSGGGTATFPATVTIPEYEAGVSFELVATGAGPYTLNATAQNRLPATLAFSIQPQFAITGFTPAEGPVGTAVAISGTGFDPNLSANQVKFNGEAAVIVSGNAALLNAIVPPRATTGPITVTNTLGTAASAIAFTVQEREAFDIAVAPGAIQVPPGGLGSTRIRLASTGLNPYPYAASVAITGLPAGVTATLDRPMVALNLDAIVTLSAVAGASAGSFNISVTATGASGVRTQTVTKTFPVQILAAGSTTVTGRVFHSDDDAPFGGARVRLGGAHVFTDETGTYRFVNPPLLGDQVLLIDGNTNNTPEFEYPSGIAMPVLIVAGQDNKGLTSYIGRVDATKFTNVAPGQAASVTDADIPNFSLNIPAGVTIYGWDGQPVTKINVRKVPIDRLPIRPIPEGVDTRSVYLYYFFREGGGTPTQPIPVTMQNDIDALPGEQVTLWYYDESATPDPNSNQWRIMGLGTVSDDGKSIVSNPGVGMPRFCCGASFPQRGAGGATGGNGGNGCGPQSPNPVDLASGNALVFRPRPFGITKLVSVDPNCQYRSTDSRLGLFGRGMSFSYDWFAEQVGTLAVRVTNPAGAQFMLSRDADGVYRSTSGRSLAIEMEVFPSASGRTLRMVDGTQYEFRAQGQLNAMVDPAGNRTSFQLNAQGFPQSMTDPVGKVYQFQTVGNPPTITRVTDPAGRFVQFDYDASRRLIRYTDQGGGVTVLEYDANNRIRQMTNPRGAVKTIEYDTAGRAVRETLPDNSEERYTYNAAGSTVAETRYTDANGNVTSYRFNGLGFETSMTDALGRTTRRGLDPVNNVVRSITDAAGRVTQRTYNQRGDLIRTIDPEGNQTLIEYDLRFRKPVRIENALGNVTTMQYDSRGNLTRSTNAENETTTFKYTSRGQVETITDPLNRVTRFGYDADGNLVESTNPAGETVTRAYDLANRLAEVTDSLNRTTHFAYDDLDRLSDVRDAIQGLTRFAYDSNDNLLSVTDANSNPVERNVYDLRNRLVRKIDAGNRDTVYAYDGVGNLIRMTDRKGQVNEYGYDALKRLTRIQDQDGRITAYAYDLAGNLARISDTVSGDILMSYDRLDRLVEVVTPQGTLAYGYDAIGRRLTRTLSGGDVTAYSYDRANRLKTVSLRGKTATYSYDAAGRLNEKILPNSLKATYQYDAVNRVTGIAYTTSDNTVVESIDYAYDSGGQRTQKALGAASLQETAFAASYDEANRLTQITLSGETFTLAYDENGNLASKVGSTSGTTTYTWDARNQLVAISGPVASATFRYDAIGRRIEKTVNGASTGFIYDGAQTVAELSGSALDTVYHTGIQIDEVLARYAPSGNKTLLTDALLSVIALAHEDQSLANSYAYSPYGEATTLGPDDGNTLQYTGRENDGTGLYYYRARYYDAILKRFITEDPIGIAGGINLYAYANNQPPLFNDPRGLAPPGACDYYTRVCEQTESIYHCRIAPTVCETFPENPPILPPGWTPCVRRCLQLKDPQCTPRQCPATPDPACLVRIHQECWTECYSNPKSY